MAGFKHINIYIKRNSSFAMSLVKLTELDYGDIVEINAGLARVSGYFIRKDEHHIYIASAISVDNCVSNTPVGYLMNNLRIELLKKNR